MIEAALELWDVLSRNALRTFAICNRATTPLPRPPVAQGAVRPTRVRDRFPPSGANFALVSFQDRQRLRLMEKFARTIAAELRVFRERWIRPQTRWSKSEDPVGNLLHYAIVFLIVALVAAVLGFGGVAGTAMEGARLIFWVAIVLFVVSLIANFVRRA